MNTAKRMIPSLNPWSMRFLERIPIFSTMIRNRAQRHEAQQHLQKVMEAYKALVSDPRYKLVHEDVRRAVGEQLTLLVERASECSTCSKYALSVRFLTEVVSDPVEQVWYDNQRARMEEQGLEEGA